MPKISGSNIMITNCRFTSFPFDGPGNLNIDAYYRNIDGVCLEGVNLDFGAHDGFDGGRQLVLALERLLLFGTGADQQRHGRELHRARNGLPTGLEGTRRRHAGAGITHLRTLNTVLDDGPYQHQRNSAFYLEDVHGGLNDILIAESWLSGAGTRSPPTS